MRVENQIRNYLDSLSELKRSELSYLHNLIIEKYPDSRLWFLDGKNEEGKVVANPNIGYGQSIIQYADGSSKEFYRVGISANSTGISVYIMGLPYKNSLVEMFADKIGKAKVTSYCIKFNSLKDIDLSVLAEAIFFGLSIID
jgi:hypothetical protein